MLHANYMPFAPGPQLRGSVLLTTDPVPGGEQMLNKYEGVTFGSFATWNMEQKEVRVRVALHWEDRPPQTADKLPTKHVQFPC